MTGEQQSAPMGSVTMQIRKAADFRSIYTNWVQASHTPFDISLTLGEAVSVDANQFEVEQSARVVFSPLEAKIALVMLAGTIKAFESSFGTIVVPPGILRPEQDMSEEGQP
jgi:Protein of unknown function (DUF3467)